MLFLVNWKPRGQSEEEIKRRLELIGNWSPPDGWENRGSYAFVDGSGGISIVAAESEEPLARGITDLMPYFDFEVMPMMDIGAWRSLTHTGIAFRDSVEPITPP